MWTAGSNFSHIVQEQRREGHALVTDGVYSVFRHPSYTGWFYWAIGTQVVLGNPICSVVYALAAWYFFRRRIPHEEEALEAMYPEVYAAYRRRTGIYIPFVLHGVEQPEFSS